MNMISLFQMRLQTRSEKLSSLKRVTQQNQICLLVLGLAIRANLRGVDDTVQTGGAPELSGTACTHRLASPWGLF
jgi:hypothetical protein